MRGIVLASLVLASANFVYGQSIGAKIPKVIKAYLDTTYGEWRFSPITQQMKDDFFPTNRHNPSLGWGDFDQDGSRDYVVQISQGHGPNAKRTVIVFLKRQQYFAPYVLETNSDDPEIFIAVTEKGAKGYDWKKGKPFTYSSDAITVSYAGKGGVSYLFQEGQFVRIQTGD